MTRAAFVVRSLARPPPVPEAPHHSLELDADARKPIAYNKSQIQFYRVTRSSTQFLWLCVLLLSHANCFGALAHQLSNVSFAVRAAVGVDEPGRTGDRMTVAKNVCGCEGGGTNKQIQATRTKISHAHARIIWYSCSRALAHARRFVCACEVFYWQPPRVFYGHVCRCTHANEIIPSTTRGPLREFAKRAHIHFAIFSIRPAIKWRTHTHTLWAFVFI